jgi:hypothetical protein
MRIKSRVINNAALLHADILACYSLFNSKLPCPSDIELDSASTLKPVSSMRTWQSDVLVDGQQPARLWLTEELGQLSSPSTIVDHALQIPKKLAHPTLRHPVGSGVGLEGTFVMKLRAHDWLTVDC